MLGCKVVRVLSMWMDRTDWLLDLSLRLQVLRKSFIWNERTLLAKDEIQSEDADLHFSIKELARNVFQ